MKIGIQVLSELAIVVIILILLAAFCILLEKIPSDTKLGKIVSREGIRMAIAFLISLGVFLLGVMVYSYCFV